MTQNTTSVAQECIFCAIVAGQAEASVVFEDETVVVFMDPAEQRTFRWARQDLNLQPTDYESVCREPVTRESAVILGPWCAVGARQVRP